MAQPDIIVSIDFGTTFTGVAWMTPRTPIQVINNWPGSGDQAERKVPTSLIFNPDGSLSSWGFMCADDDLLSFSPELYGSVQKCRREFFKIFLDADTLRAAQTQRLPNVPAGTDEAARFCTEYLRRVYAHVKDTVETQTGRKWQPGGWAACSVAFLFSVPTTWTSLEIVNSFKQVVRAAGFGTEGPLHSASVDLTEAEAAAVAVLKTSPVNFRPGDMFLCVDAGGGTTDLALMRVTSTDALVPRMAQVSAVKGVGIGASLIDRAFVALVARRLAAFPDIVDQLPANYPQRMAQSHHFRTVKHKFGEPAYMQPVYRIPMEGVSHDFEHPGIRVEGGRMVFTMEEMQSLFDPQVDGIVKRVIEQLNWLSENGQADQVQYMILSGGLGSSAYVRARLEEQFQYFPHPNAPSIAIIPCQDPTLVVVRGLLQDRQQRLETPGGQSVLATRIARASYGILIKQRYNPSIHFNEDVQVDRFDPEVRWATRQVQWVIRKGDVVDPNAPIAHNFEIWLSAQETTRSWNAEVVVSHVEKGGLPYSMKQGGVTKLCDVRSNLTGVEQEQLIKKFKRGSCFSRGVTYYVCKFDIKVLVGPADLTFELWFGGQKFSGNHEPITVTWDDEGARVKGA